ncbi:hypothetical protein PIB30_111856 [Stylosanthes scabra]|uniref:Uncharacterized protein n=1 Tax=Stylosanthes scabra TaxID=79078 RepID=A0ABU6UZF0_9FABA|nr:hypothetical protein [Stylosanthes scabra]
MANHSSRTAESQDRTWKASTVVTRAPGREKGRHPFSPRILAEEIPKKFRYPVEIEPYDGTTDPKHHLDAFENRMLLVNASDAIQSPKNLSEPILDRTKTQRNSPELPGPFQHGMYANRRTAIPSRPDGFG